MAKVTKRTSRPHITRQITLNTYDAQHLFERSYTHTTSAFFLLGIILPAIGDEDQADEYAEVITGELRRCGDDLDIEIKRMNSFIEENGLSIDAIDYTNSKVESTAICSPMDNLYLGMIQQLDELAGLMSLLWIGGVFDQKQYRAGLHSWRRRIQRLGSRPSGNVSRAMSSAKNKGKQDAMTEAMAEHGVEEDALQDIEQDSQLIEQDGQLIDTEDATAE